MTVILTTMQTCAIDTSILVRLASRQPQDQFTETVSDLQVLASRHPGIQVLATCMVIGESYVSLQHFYGLTKQEARDALSAVLQSGLVAPAAGQRAIDALQEASKGAGLMDRLIVLDAETNAFLPLLTHDKKLAKVTGAMLLREVAA